MEQWSNKLAALRAAHEALLNRKNEPIGYENAQHSTFNVQLPNGIYTKYKYPILTAEHTPLEWRYDLCEQSNPHLMQRIMMNAAGIPCAQPHGFQLQLTKQKNNN